MSGITELRLQDWLIALEQNKDSLGVSLMRVGRRNAMCPGQWCYEVGKLGIVAYGRTRAEAEVKGLASLVICSGVYGSWAEDELTEVAKAEKRELERLAATIGVNEYRTR